MAVTKWTLSDGEESMTFKFNPETMESPYAQKELQISTLHLQTIMNPSKAAQWSFSGNIYTEDEYERLISWHEKDVVLWLTDHLLRTWKIVSEDLNITDRRNTAKNSTRWKYQWKVLVLGRVEESS